MQDQITPLCRKLLRTRLPDEIHPISQQLRHAITDQVERIRERVVGVAIIERIVERELLGMNARGDQ